jgi:hypothetical protein
MPQPLTPPSYTAIRATIRRLRASPHRHLVFGAAEHNFELKPVLSEHEVSDFERRHRIVLPREYRRFLTEVGNGVAGPYYGLFPLGMIDSYEGHEPWREVGGIVGILSAPFPHADSWNTSFDPDEEGVSDDEFQAAEVANWSPELVSGAVPICHAGCCLRYWLVVSGPLAGHVWYDARVDWDGLSPVIVDGRRDTFLSWYCRWLEDAAWTVDRCGITD